MKKEYVADIPPPTVTFVEFVNDSILIWQQGFSLEGTKIDSFLYFKQKRTIIIKNDTIISKINNKKITQFIFHPIWIKEDYSIDNYFPKYFIRSDKKRKFSLKKKYLEPIFIQND